MFSNVIKSYGLANPEKFNEDFIYLKKNDNVLTYINNILKALEIVEGVHFIESELITDESKFPDNIKDGKVLYSIEESRLDLIRFKFKLSCVEKVKDKEELVEEEVERFMFFPKLIDNFYMQINNSRFSPIYQIIDSDTYRINNAVILKTLLMPIIVREKNVCYEDINDTEYDENILVLDIFKNKINYLHYFIAEYGITKTLEFLGAENYVNILNSDDEYNNLENKDKYTIFNLGEGFKIAFKNNFFKVRKKLCINIVDLFVTNKATPSTYSDINFWIVELGKYFSKNKNSYENKAKDILISFKRILDEGTKRNLKLKDESKKDIFCVIRWLTDNYDVLKYKDNMDLKNKRIRVYEYLLYDLTCKFSTVTYRLLNKTDLTMKDLKQLFSTITMMTIMKSLSNNELLRYNNAVNTIDIFNSNLKFSHRGKQALGEGNRQVQDSYRGHHPSYIGRIGLTTASASDPGRPTVMPEYEFIHTALL